MSSLILPASGGMRNGELYELPELEHRTTETDFSYLPTPRAQNGEKRNQTVYVRNGPVNLENALALLPTPTVMDMGGGQDSGAMEPVAGGDAVKASERKWSRTKPLSGVAWGRYSTAIRRWELITDRVAPYPIAQVGSKGIVNPVFVEWMMGLPEGWVTGHGLSASQELKMLGNGVVPQQAALALRLLGAA